MSINFLRKKETVFEVHTGGTVRAEKKTIRFKATIERVRRVCAGSFVGEEDDEG